MTIQFSKKILTHAHKTAKPIGEQTLQRLNVAGIASLKTLDSKAFQRLEQIGNGYGIDASKLQANLGAIPHLKDSNVLSELENNRHLPVNENLHAALGKKNIVAIFDLFDNRIVLWKNSKPLDADGLIEYSLFRLVNCKDADKAKSPGNKDVLAFGRLLLISRYPNIDFSSISPDKLLSTASLNISSSQEIEAVWITGMSNLITRYEQLFEDTVPENEINNLKKLIQEMIDRIRSAEAKGKAMKDKSQPKTNKQTFRYSFIWAVKSSFTKGAPSDPKTVFNGMSYEEAKILCQQVERLTTEDKVVADLKISDTQLANIKKVLLQKLYGFYSPN